MMQSVVRLQAAILSRAVNTVAHLCEGSNHGSDKDLLACAQKALTYQMSIGDEVRVLRDVTESS